MPIILQTPCDADWSQMKKTESGKFCQQCSKEVVDLTNKTNEEAERIIRESAAPVCAMLKSSQLYPKQEKRKKILHLLFALLITFGTALFSLDAKAQEAVENFKYSSENEYQEMVIVKGKVKDENGEPLPCTAVFFVTESDKPIGVQSDIDGNFSLQIPKRLIKNSQLVISFRMIGFEDQDLEIQYSGESDRFRYDIEMIEREAVFGGAVICVFPSLIPKTDFGKTTLSGDALRRGLRH